MSLTAAERETVITLNDEDGHAEIYTAQRPVITKLKKNPLATLLEEGVFDGSAWATFRLPADRLSFLTTYKTGNGRPKTPEEIAAANERMKKAREARGDKAA